MRRLVQITVSLLLPEEMFDEHTDLDDWVVSSVQLDGPLSQTTGVQDVIEQQILPARLEVVPT